MTAKHTPGPWHTETTIEPSGKVEAIAVRDSNGLLIANVEPQVEFVANGRLLAAGPDLLAALRQAADDLHMCARWFNQVKREADFSAALNFEQLARAVIAKNGL